MAVLADLIASARLDQIGSVAAESGEATYLFLSGDTGVSVPVDDVPERLVAVLKWVQDRSPL